MVRKRQNENHTFPPSRFSPGSASRLPSQLLCLLSPSGTGGWERGVGNRGLRSGPNGCSRRFPPPHTFPCPSASPLQVPSGQTHLLCVGSSRGCRELLLWHLWPFFLLLLLRPWGSHCSLTLFSPHPQAEFCPFLKRASTEEPPASLTSSAVPCAEAAAEPPGTTQNRLEPAGTGSVQRGAAPPLLTEPLQPPLPAPTHPVHRQRH